MIVKVVKEGGQITLFLSGTIDIPNADLLKKKLNKIAEKNLKEIIVDFNGVDSIGSSAIGALLLSHKELKASGIDFQIVNVNQEIKALFKIIKLDKIFKI